MLGKFHDRFERAEGSAFVDHCNALQCPQKEALQA
jgi:hypothetical protein